MRRSLARCRICEIFRGGDRRLNPAHPPTAQAESRDNTGGKTAGGTFMPELPDIVVYIEALQERIAGQTLDHVRLMSPFLLRTTAPSIDSVVGKTIRELRRIGKRIAIGLDGDLWLVLHLMIAGRLHWRTTGVKLSARRDLAAFDFTNGSLLLTEAGSRRRASLHVVSGDEGLAALDRGGLEVLDASEEAFAAALKSENHTLKRALTDPAIFSGIGNAYSDEILHRARLSPVTLTSRLAGDETSRLYAATRTTLLEWIGRLRIAGKFPEKVTAFRPEMAVHGKYGQPCPACGTKIQRIRFAANETNYCPQCQTGGRLLADRSLSRLLKADWPRTLEEMEDRLRQRNGPQPPPGVGVAVKQQRADRRAQKNQRAVSNPLPGRDR